VGLSGITTIDVYNLASGSNAAILNAGFLSAGGANNSVGISIGGAAVPVGVYKVVGFTSIPAPTRSTSHRFRCRRANGGSLIFSSTAAEIDLNITSFDLPEWTGAGNGIWTTGGQTPKNWCWLPTTSPALTSSPVTRRYSTTSPPAQRSTLTRATSRPSV